MLSLLAFVEHEICSPQLDSKKILFALIIKAKAAMATTTFTTTEPSNIMHEIFLLAIFICLEASSRTREKRTQKFMQNKTR